MGYDFRRADEATVSSSLNVHAMASVRDALVMAGVLNEASIRFGLRPDETDVPADVLRAQLPEGEGVPLYKLCLNEGAWLSERECELMAVALRTLTAETRSKVALTETEVSRLELIDEFALFCEGCISHGGFFVS